MGARMAQSFAALPAGARAAVEQQWAALAAGGLPCGASVVDEEGRVIAVGRNRAYDPAGDLATRMHSPLQHNRLAHAELNALSLVPTEADHAHLTVWSTQHPCLMCAAAIRFIGVGKVCFIADDPSDHAPAEAIAATRGGVRYDRLDDPLWWTICNVLFLYNSAAQQGEAARNLSTNRGRYPELVALALELARDGLIGRAAREGAGIMEALAPCEPAIARVASAMLRT